MCSSFVDCDRATAAGVWQQIRTMVVCVSQTTRSLLWQLVSPANIGLDFVSASDELRQVLQVVVQFWVLQEGSGQGALPLL